MKHPLTDGAGPGEWADDSKERRLVSLAEKRLVDAVARIAELEAALREIAEIEGPTTYSWGLDYFYRAVYIARAALSTKEDN